MDRFVDRKRNIFEPSVSAKKDYKNIVMLAYYRSNLIHVFIHDAEIAGAILGLSNIHDISKGVSTDLIWDKFLYLQTLLSEEFVVRKSIKTKEQFNQALTFLEDRNQFKLDKQASTLSVNLQDS